MLSQVEFFTYQYLVSLRCFVCTVFTRNILRTDKSLHVTNFFSKFSRLNYSFILRSLLDFVKVRGPFASSSCINSWGLHTVPKPSPINQDVFDANLIRGLNNFDTRPSELNWKGNFKNMNFPWLGKGAFKDRF